MSDFKRIILSILAANTLSTTPLCASAAASEPAEDAFIKGHPEIPRENRACTLGTYDPKNESQEEALKWARRVMGLPSSTGAGLWLWGPVGVGKSHLAVGIARDLSDRGKKVFFYQGGPSSALSSRIAPQYDVFVLDDMNSFYGSGGAFREIVLECFNKGKHLFVTSNASYETLLPQAFVAAADEKPRFEDRIQNMIKVLHIGGSSQRSGASWMNNFSDDEDISPKVKKNGEFDNDENSNLDSEGRK